MSITTRPPSENILDIVPEMEKFGKTTVRLHPRKKKVADPAASKFGTPFLWPFDEAWPEVINPELADFIDRKEEGLPDGDFSIPLVAVLQLRQDEFPEMDFFPGTDLFQLLWCPLSTESSMDSRELLSPFVYWRDSSGVTDVMREQPVLKEADHYTSMVGVTNCQLNPERVTEYPSPDDLDYKLYGSRIDEWLEGQNLDPSLYRAELSVADGCKVGGYPVWVQDTEVPKCNCGDQMEYLLTLSDSEFDGAYWDRWAPLELGDDPWEHPDVESAVEPVCSSLGGNYQMFVCRRCDNWPVKAIFQR